MTMFIFQKIKNYVSPQAGLMHSFLLTLVKYLTVVLLASRNCTVIELERSIKNNDHLH